MTAGVLQEHAIAKTTVMGVLNVTPDSFFDGGRFAEAPAALAHARAMIREGADLVDVGGESSRPGAESLSAEAEIARVLPVIERLAEEDLPFSLDTYHAETARRGLEHGARLINDITALQGDPEMAHVLADHEAACVLMHMRGNPRTMQEAPAYDDVVEDLCAFFEERIAFAEHAGIARARLWLDPGFGFGKTLEHNLELLRRLREFKRFGLPLLVGTSNKSMIGQILGGTADERREGTAATVAIAILNGADAVRVHDVKAMAQVARMTDAVLGAPKQPNALI